MHADRLNIRARSKADDSSQHVLRIVDDGAWFGARHQSAVRTISTIRKCLPGCPKAGGLRCGYKLGLWKAEEDQGAIDRDDASRDCVRHTAIVYGDVVQRAVGLDVLQANALIRGDTRERLNLANDQICYLG